MSRPHPSVFISYAWEDDVKEWVHTFATRLRADGIDAKIDQWSLVLGDPLPEFMERSVRTNDFVLIVCTPRYKEKADSRKGGVGYEGETITAEVFAKENHRKFIPILHKGAWQTSAPSFLLGKLHSDLRGEPYNDTVYAALLRTLLGQLASPPPLGSAPSFEGGTASRTATPSSSATAHGGGRRAENSRLGNDHPPPKKNTAEGTAFRDGAAIVRRLKSQLPRHLQREESANGSTVFIDPDSRHRIKIREFLYHCRIYVRCSDKWRACRTRGHAEDRNGTGWLSPVDVRTEQDLSGVLALYRKEWASFD